MIRTDGQTDGRMDGAGVGMYAPLQRSFVAVPAGCTSRDESWQLLAVGASPGSRKTRTASGYPQDGLNII